MPSCRASCRVGRWRCGGQRAISKATDAEAIALRQDVAGCVLWLIVEHLGCVFAALRPLRPAGVPALGLRSFHPPGKVVDTAVDDHPAFSRVVLRGDIIRRVPSRRASDSDDAGKLWGLAVLLCATAAARGPPARVTEGVMAAGVVAVVLGDANNAAWLAPREMYLKHLKSVVPVRSVAWFPLSHCAPLLRGQPSTHQAAVPNAALPPRCGSD
eukprot:gene7234-biopygen5440